MSKPPKVNFKALIANDVAPNKAIGEEAAAAAQKMASAAPASIAAAEPAAPAPAAPPADAPPSSPAAAVQQPAPTPATAPAQELRPSVISMRQRPAPRSAPAEKGRGTIRERARQLSLYLEDPVYEQIREIAHVERVKMHQLILEGVDLVLKKRGSPSIKELMKKAG